MRNQIEFLINGRLHRAGAGGETAMLADYLRGSAGATGTKIVCAEGDCGACTVLVRRSASEPFLPVNSCIQTLFQCDGMSIVTVEALREGNRLSAVQEAMVKCHGAQCGYCTPGFIVAMTAMQENRDGALDEHAVRAGLTGNLCRCTGYEPIIRAALEAAKAETSLKTVRERYAAMPVAAGPLRVGDAYAPESLEDAVAFRRDHPGSLIVQGATDVGVWINKRSLHPPAMLSLARIHELDSLEESGGEIVAGANVSLSRLEAFVESRIPELYRILSTFGSPQIRNAGTVIGNIANGSPIGDTIPYLFVSDAMLEIVGIAGSRTLAVSALYRGYRSLDLAPDEIITRVRIPIVTDTLKLYKVSRRRDLDISAFTAAIRLKMNGTIEDPRIAFGGVAATVIRMPRTETALRSQRPSLELFEEAGRIAREEITPISDVRGSADYRRLLASNILRKFWFDIAAEIHAEGCP